MDLMGAYGYGREGDLEKYWRDSKILSLWMGRPGAAPTRHRPVVLRRTDVLKPADGVAGGPTHDSTRTRRTPWRTVGVTITGSGEHRTTRSLTPHPASRLNPRSRWYPRTIASHRHREDSSTIRSATRSLRAEQTPPSAPTLARRRLITASCTRHRASARVSRGGTRRDLHCSCTWNTRTVDRCLVASAVVKSTAACADSPWSIASNKQSHMTTPPPSLEFEDIGSGRNSAVRIVLSGCSDRASQPARDD